MVGGHGVMNSDRILKDDWIFTVEWPNEEDWLSVQRASDGVIVSVYGHVHNASTMQGEYSGKIYLIEQKANVALGHAPLDTGFNLHPALDWANSPEHRDLNNAVFFQLNFS